MAFQSIVAVRVTVEDEDKTPKTDVEVSLTELIANWSIASYQADRDNCTGVAQRLRNDIKMLNSLKPGDSIIVYVK